jgi:hypothetical protein
MYITVIVSKFDGKKIISGPIRAFAKYALVLVVKKYPSIVQFLMRDY